VVAEESIKEIKEESKQRQIEYEKSLLRKDNKLPPEEDLSFEATQHVLVKDLEAFQVEAALRLNSISDPEVSQAFKNLEDKLECQLALLKSQPELTVVQQQHITDIIESIKDLIDNHSEEFMEPTEEDNIKDPETDEPKKPFLETHSADPNNLLAMEIRVKNFMNSTWEPFQVPRATDITEHNIDEWTMKYSIKVIEDDDTKLGYYNAMQKRRLSFFNRKGKDTFYQSSFIKMLLKICRDGYRYRKGRDSLYKNQEPVIFKPYMD
jgi:hypothetical protein